MKLLISFLLFFATNFFCNAQCLKYHRVLISGGSDLQKKLHDLDITIDHAHIRGSEIITEIDEPEVKRLKDNLISYKVLIYDLAQFYEQRNQHDRLLKSPLPVDCNDPNIKVPSHFRLGSMGGYFTLYEMEGILDSMALFYQNLITIKQQISTVQSLEGRKIWFVKISDNPNIDENEPEVLYTSLHHAREAASLSQLIFYMWYLLENYATDADVKATVDNTEMFFVPCVNPDGYVYNQTTNPNGGGMWRKNRRLNADSTYGVDLNRNYGYNWGYDNFGSSPNTQAQTFRGTSAFSEPETQAMRNFCNSRQFKNALNAHTYSNVLIYPWGFVPGLLTPDSTIYRNWGKLLTRDSRFLYGTCDETLGYLTNGSSDDWMYGEQGSKPKIFGMTPEAGNYLDGFWPAPSRIIDICKTTFTQNYNLAKLAANLVFVKDEHDKFISGNTYIKYSIQRLGLSASQATVSLIPVSAAITVPVATMTYSNLLMGQKIIDSILVNVNSGLSPAQKISYILRAEDGGTSFSDTVTKIFGTPVTVFYDDCSQLGSFDVVGNWAVNTGDFVIPPGSITDSPGGTYSANQKTHITTSVLSLTNAVYAHLQYFTRFEIEKTFDNTQIQVSTNLGGSYSPLCGIYQTSPASNGGIVPLYDGKQNEWVKEDIDLSDYLGQQIMLRFTLDSDFYEDKDGFYFDELLVRKIRNDNLLGLTDSEYIPKEIKVSPIPSSGIFNLKSYDSEPVYFEVYNGIGQIILRDKYTTQYILDLSLQLPGFYFVHFKNQRISVTKKLVIER